MGKNRTGPKLPIILVGNPNSGKTTLFNQLTGMNQKIGNWPGVTIEKKEGIIKDTNFKLIDLPGLYSLNPYTEEEKISSDYILNGDAGAIINIVDATCLERSLYLTTQILEMDYNVIIALNKVDALSKKGIHINVKRLERELGVTVCEISALHEKGIDNLIQTIKKSQKTTDPKWEMSQKTTDPKWEKSQKTTDPKWDKWTFITGVVQKCVTWEKSQKTTDPKWDTDMLDRLFLNKILGIPIFIGIMFGIYYLSVGVVGKFTTNVINEQMLNLSNLIQYKLYNIGAVEWLRSLIVDGIMKGVGSVISFVPQLSILFICMSILEASGYLARVAFIMDALFRKIGLSGKSVIPFILGSGCSVPGIMCTKIIKNEDEKKLTSILVPFIPCSAKLPIIALFSGYFFEENAGIASGSLYLLSIIIIIISSIILKKYAFRNTSSTFILELPEYRLPDFKYIVKNVWFQVKSFIKRAGSTIFIASIVIWFLLSFSLRLEYGIPIEKSILAFIGKKISWIFYPMLGVNSWEASVSCIQGLIAKEQVISSMAIISGFQGNDIFNSGSVFEFFNPISAYSFMVFNLFSAPCFAAIGCMKHTLNSTKKTILSILYQTTVAGCLASLIYKVLSIAIFDKI